MLSVLAVMLVAVCEPDLVHCAPLTHWHAIWRTVEDCQLDRARVQDITRTRHGSGKSIMTTCRLTVDHDGRLQATLPLRDPGPATGALF